MDKLLRTVLTLAIALSLILAFGVSSIAHADPGQPGTGESIHAEPSVPIEKDEPESSDEDKSEDDESEDDSTEGQDNDN